MPKYPSKYDYAVTHSAKSRVFVIAVTSAILAVLALLILYMR